MGKRRGSFRRRKSQTFCRLLRFKQEDKTRFESQLAATRSSANLFKYFKAFKKEKIPSKLKWEKEEAHSDAEKAKHFADFFASTYKTSSKIKEPISQDMFYPKLANVEFTRQEISNICSQVHVNKSKEPDNLPQIRFWEVSDHISSSLFQIFKEVFQTSNFPSVWKEAIVSPIYKKGINLNAEINRPVSLLSITSKIFERILFKRLFLQVRPYLHKAQYGFISGRSTVLQLMVMIQKTYHELENNLYVDIVLTDFSKAFDQVYHGILLRSFILREDSWDSSTATSPEGHKGSALTKPVPKMRVEKGVLQGSLVGSLMFLIYKNDLVSCCENINPLLFAEIQNFWG